MCQKEKQNRESQYRSKTVQEKKKIQRRNYVVAKIRKTSIGLYISKLMCNLYNKIKYY